MNEKESRTIRKIQVRLENNKKLGMNTLTFFDAEINILLNVLSDHESRKTTFIEKLEAKSEQISNELENLVSILNCDVDQKYYLVQQFRIDEVIELAKEEL